MSLPLHLPTQASTSFYSPGLGPLLPNSWLWVESPRKHTFTSFKTYLPRQGLYLDTESLQA